MWYCELQNLKKQHLIGRKKANSIKEKLWKVKNEAMNAERLLTVVNKKKNIPPVRECAIALKPALPVEGVSVILGNDLAGGTVWEEVPPPPLVTTGPTVLSGPYSSSEENF